ncbi:MAG: 30S ribosomal protein S9 [Candidatus Dependentiae bacterium]|nr:30S ribosomal protein S9 [Candidatus Dependentiae bacterium]
MTATAKPKKVTSSSPKASSKSLKSLKPASTTPIAHGVGRRKAAVARAWLKNGSGNIVVNGKNYRDYFDTEVARTEASSPFTLIPASKDLDVDVNVYGGGLIAQAGAVKLGIARAMVEADETIRPTLRAEKMLTVDARVKERKKYGQKAARRKFQFVKR